ncbi:CRISPR-associated protein [Halothiobacillus diazotrophicus]|uniref:CRISPR-associated protein n=1 Tax=Halothiobacillus diazotrophicus TaxID=1860122 RepID=A0A191ZFL7_9GAMM|nr:CRISPR-associated ring nuclease Csm6 [Halothiobacillus diazotrophicus]ANJ66647.1 CRISPR-associated protein [Halothiobacillus diazotrophicus]
MNDIHIKKRILLCVTGMSPQVMTETLYALAVNPEAGQGAWIPNEVHIITTASGADQARLNLLSQDTGWFKKLCDDYSLPPIAFGSSHIHCITDEAGQVLDDIRTPADNEAAANSIAELVRDLTHDPNSALHVSLAGGRKTMGYYTGYALSLYGRPQDQLSHILVSAPYESHPEFYYPTPYPRIIQSREPKPRAFNCADATIQLAHIPFVRLREGMPHRLLDGKANFTETVKLANLAHEPATLRINQSREARGIRVNGIPVPLTDTPFALLYWLARRANSENPEVDWIEHAEFLEHVTKLYGKDSHIYEEVERALRSCRGDEEQIKKYFQPIKSRMNTILKEELGATLAARCQSPKSSRGGGNRLPEDLTIIFDNN